MLKPLLFVLAFLCAVGCSAAPSDPSGLRTTFWTDEAELFDPLTEATERVAAATGRPDIYVAAAGIPVRLDYHPMLDGDRLCAGSTIAPGRSVDFVRVDSDPRPGFCMQTPETLIHEVMHALTLGLAPHSATGIFTAEAVAAERKIDAASLEQLCSFFDCPAFQPE